MMRRQSTLFLEECHKLCASSSQARRRAEFALDLGIAIIYYSLFYDKLI